LRCILLNGQIVKTSQLRWSVDVTQCEENSITVYGIHPPYRIAREIGYYKVARGFDSQVGDSLEGHPVPDEIGRYHNTISSGGINLEYRLRITHEQLPSRRSRQAAKAPRKERAIADEGVLGARWWRRHRAS
jgi:hypothetical protein